MTRSRQPPDESVTQKRPDSPTFFVDRCLGRYVFPSPLREPGLRVEVHDDHFADAAPDGEWLPAVGERGWVVIALFTALATSKLMEISPVNGDVDGVLP